MAASWEHDQTRDLIAQLDDRLREAQQVRGQAEQGSKSAPFFPDRRRKSRVFVPPAFENSDVSADTP
jgi:hypothetical protein